MCEEEIDINDKNVVTCVICQNQFHAFYSKDDTTKNCATVNASEFKIIEMKRKQCLFVYRCSSCTEKDEVIVSKLDSFIKDLNKSISKIDQYKDELKLLPELCQGIKDFNNNKIPEIENDVKILCNSVSKIQTETIPNLELKLTDQINDIKSNQIQENNSQDFEEKIANTVICEINERNYKEKNVIMYNFPDANDIIKDKEAIISLLNNENLDLSYIRVSRIGKFVAGKNRPVRICTNSTDHVAFILANNDEIGKNSIQKIPNLQNNPKDNKKIPVVCAHDKTRMESLLLKKAKAELNDRKSKGENNLRIKFFNGFPKVIKINSNEPDNGQKNS